MKKLITALFLFCVFAVHNNGWASSEKGDYCVNDMKKYIREATGLEPTVVSVTKDQYSCELNKSGIGTCYWVRTNLCNGYFAGRTSVPPTECKSAYYGSRPPYIRRASFWATGECKALLRDRG